MKAITLWQPWATLVAHGLKHFETRGWAVKFCGPIAIHAAKRPVDYRELNPVIGKSLNQLGYANVALLPLGCVVCIADLVDCLPTEEVVQNIFFKQIAATEQHFGDFRPGRFAWQLDNIVRVDNIPAQGGQGIWDWRPPEGVLPEVQS